MHINVVSFLINIFTMPKYFRNAEIKYYYIYSIENVTSDATEVIYTHIHTHIHIYVFF